MKPISSASWNNTSWSKNTAATSAKRSRPATGRCRQGIRAVDHEGDQRRPDRNRQQRDQVPAQRDPPPHAAAGKVDHPGAPGQRVGDQEGAQADAENPANHSVQRQVERQDLGIHNRWDHTHSEGRDQADHHERGNGMPRDRAKHR